MTINPPTNLGFGLVNARFIYDVIDSPDEGGSPDFQAMSGTVVFTASVPKAINATAVPDPLIMGRTQIRGHINEDGYLVTRDTTGNELYRGVNLIATDDPDLNPANWVWFVDYNLQIDGVQISGFERHELAVPAGSVQDLANFVDPGYTQPIGQAQVIALNAQAIQTLAAAQAVEQEMDDLLDDLGSYIITDAEVRSDGHLHFIRPDDSELDAGLVRPNLQVGTVAVGVPSASMSGTPEAPLLNMTFPAASWNGTALGTIDLDTVTTPGIYMQATGADATLARHYPRASIVGVLEVLPHLPSSTRVIQRYTVYSAGSGTPAFFERRLFGGTWSVWQVYASQRVDQSNNVGRAIYVWDDINGREQLIYGDTGWRNVAGLLINGWTAEFAALRRIGYEVTLAIRNLNPAAATGDGFLPSPPGFSLGTGDLGNSIGGTASDGKTVFIGSGGTWGATATGGAISAARTSFIRLPTAQSWPTALPGTAVGTIPNL